MINDSVNNLIKKAQDSLDASELLLNNGYIDISISRTYYSMFYAVEALLLSDNLSYTKHSAVISAFGKNYIKTGLINVKLHKYLSDAFDVRQLTDYATFLVFNKEKALELIEKSKFLLLSIKDYLSNK